MSTNQIENNLGYIIFFVKVQMEKLVKQGKRKHVQYSVDHK